MIVVSLFTKQASEEKLKEITFISQTPKQCAETRASWNCIDVVTSLGVVAICVDFIFISGKENNKICLKN